MRAGSQHACTYHTTPHLPTLRTTTGTAHLHMQCRHAAGLLAISMNAQLGVHVRCDAQERKPTSTESTSSQMLPALLDSYIPVVRPGSCIHVHVSYGSTDVVRRAVRAISGCAGRAAATNMAYSGSGVCMARLPAPNVAMAAPPACRLYPSSCCCRCPQCV